MTSDIFYWRGPGWYSGLEVEDTNRCRKILPGMNNRFWKFLATLIVRCLGRYGPHYIKSMGEARGWGYDLFEYHGYLISEPFHVDTLDKK